MYYICKFQNYGIRMACHYTCNGQKYAKVYKRHDVITHVIDEGVCKL